MSNYIKRFLKSSSLSLMSLVFSALIILGCLYFYMALSLPDVVELKDIHLQVPLRVYTSDGKLIGEFGEKKRIPVFINQVPKQLIQAILDTEDQRYYEHRGVDFIGLVRAAVAVATSGKKTQGASTITMQVARNFFLSPEKTYARKINEILLAFKIDRTFSKQEILELYLNKIYLGQRAYGVAAASQVYFGKNLAQLSLSEMALLAGLPQAPSRDNPIANLDAAKERRDHVLQRMLENGHITAREYQEAIAAPIVINYHPQVSEIEASYLAEMVRNTLYERLGDQAYDAGLRVYTTLDSHLQQVAHKALQAGLFAYDARHGYRGAEENFGSFKLHNKILWQEHLNDISPYEGIYPAAVTKLKSSGAAVLLANGDILELGNAQLKAAHGHIKVGDVIRIKKDATGQWILTQLPKIEGAMVALQPQTGKVLALDGGFSYAKSSFNRAIQAGRQTGSSFKPFIYSAAFDKGYTLASVINDAPVVMAIPGSSTIWRPQNDTQKFYGPTRLRVALIQSRNLVSVRLLQAIGVSYAANYVKRFGFDSNEIPVAPSLALGTASLSPLKLTAGYAVFANGGYKVLPFFIDKIYNRDNKLVFQSKIADVPPSVIYASDAGDGMSKTISANNNAETQRAITPQNAYLITSALKDVIKYGTAHQAVVLQREDLAGKTGTTNEQKDGWFAGYNADIVATVWMGFDQPSSIYEHGAQAALPVWMDFMREALAGKPEHGVPQPDGIITVKIDPRSGLLARSGQGNAIFEDFTAETVPTKEASADSEEGYGDAAEEGGEDIIDDGDGGQLF